jgi:hypothetical protein
MTALAHRQQIAFVTISSREGIGMVKPVPLAIAEIIVFFLATHWLVTLSLMVRELVILYVRINHLLDIGDDWLLQNIIPNRSDFELFWLVLRSDWSWLWC